MLRGLFASIVLIAFLSAVSCMRAAEVTNIEASSMVLMEEVEELQPRKIPPAPKTYHVVKEGENLFEKSNEMDRDKKLEDSKLSKTYETSTPSYSQRAVVLTYHHISNNPFSGITITPERFEEDLKMLKDNNFNVISLREMLQAIDGKSQLPPNAVVITFDDGLESFYKYAFPLLKKYNFPAVEFIITARNEGYSQNDNELNPLSSMEIGEMFESGLVDIQSHTHNSHEYVYINSELKKGPALTYKIYNPETNMKESDEEYLSRITLDLQSSREIIFKYTGVYPDMLSFPFGSYNSKAWKAGKSVGFNYFITTEPGYNQENSKKATIYRIRSGDAKLTSDKLLKNIIECVNEIKE